jgi:RNA-directed DNA polymerase
MSMLDTTMVVSGSEDGSPDWNRVNWGQAERDVQRLRQRIFSASQAGDPKRVRNLQSLMLRCRANALVSVRRVTEVNAGRNTAGVDGRIVVSDSDKAVLADRVQHTVSAKALPVRRVYIPKPGGRRPLGIPVIVDRVQQAQVLNALEPEWEARFEARSYGFRPGRGCHDAIEAIFKTTSGRNTQRLWVLDADLRAAFDRVDHDFAGRQVGSFPGRDMIRSWLKAGVVEQGHLTPTEDGVPQGGVISPALLNVVLHGMEEAAGVRYHTAVSVAGWTVRGAPVVIRYADDLVALTHSREQAEQVKARLAEWLTPRGLAFNEDKTRIVHLSEGFDFLGFNVRRYPNGKLLIKPSKAALRRIRKRLAAETRALRGANAEAVIHRLDPIIRGWSAYYRSVVSSEAFGALDDHLWKLLYKWATYTHPNKPKGWIINRYFGAFNKSRRDRWVFGHQDSGTYLRKFAWTKIVRHQMVKGDASVDDPALTDYWAKRRRKRRPPLRKSDLRLLQAQHGRCPLCRGLLLHADHEPESPQEWERWLKATRKAVRQQAITVDPGRGTPDEPVAVRLIHTHCARRQTPGNSSEPASLCPL